MPKLVTQLLRCGASQLPSSTRDVLHLVFPVRLPVRRAAIVEAGNDEDICGGHKLAPLSESGWTEIGPFATGAINLSQLI